MRHDTMNPPDLVAIEAARAVGDRDRAIDLAIAAFGRGLEHPLVLQLVASGLEEDGRLEDAAGVLLRASELWPQDAIILAEFGRLLANLGRMAEALEIAQSALAIAPDAYGAHLVAGKASLRLNDVAASQLHYRRAADIAPGEAEPLSALSVIASRQGDADDARRFAERALALRPDFVSARMALAQADIFDKSPAESEARLRPLLARPDLDDDQRSEALTVLADALDAQDRPREAFAAYLAAKSILVRKHAATFTGGARENRIVHARRLADYFETAPEEAWRTPAGEDHDGARTAAGHVFLLGFPRSGTTLLEQVLASHPRVVALEEKPMLADAVDDLLSSNEGLDRLASLSVADADARRRIYWEGARSLFVTDISAKVFVDKLPLHTISLPAIAKLFPKAKIIFARRDPRDVVFSCFRRRFRMNEAMYLFLTLGGAADYYHEVMRAAEIYRLKLDLDIYTLRHEDLVADFDAEAAKALNYIGVDWDAGVRNFAARARTASSTPSTAQLAKGLSSEGVGQWRRYQRALRPVLDILEPWAKSFGYPPADLPGAAGDGDPRLANLLNGAADAVSKGDWPRAFQIAGYAEASGFANAYFDRLLGMRAQQEGRLDQAIARFESVLGDSPADVAVLNALGLCLARNGRGVEGLARLDDAIAFEPNFGPAHYNRGWTLETLGKVVGAGEAYRRALSVDPGDARALGSLAALAGRAGEWKEARDLAARALALDPGQAAAATALAGAEADDGRLEAAEDRLKAIIADTSRAGPHERAVAYSHLGDVLDRRGRYGEAFAAYQTANDTLRTLYGGRFDRPGVETALKRAARLQSQFQAVDARAWNKPAGTQAGATASPVFLMGFPRSGTTMLGQALARHRRVTTLDERETLADAVRRFMGGAEGLAELATISEEDAARYRSLYFERSGMTRDGESKVLVDKLPMNTTVLPIIRKLFPDSRIIFLRRDPRDVVLSCFRRQFVIDSTTVEFLSLGGAADLYVATMSLFELYNERLSLDIQILSYESLVADFDSETRAICDRLGLDWSSDMRGFAAGAGAVATPSSAQLARGLNVEGVGHWRHYLPWLGPVLPVLQPWVERFGYPAD